MRRAGRCRRPIGRRHRPRRPEHRPRHSTEIGHAARGARRVRVRPQPPAPRGVTYCVAISFALAAIDHASPAGVLTSMLTATDPGWWQLPLLAARHGRRRVGPCVQLGRDRRRDSSLAADGVLVVAALPAGQGSLARASRGVSSVLSRSAGLPPRRGVGLVVDHTVSADRRTNARSPTVLGLSLLAIVATSLALPASRIDDSRRVTTASASRCSTTGMVVLTRGLHSRLPASSSSAFSTAGLWLGDATPRPRCPADVSVPCTSSRGARGRRRPREWMAWQNPTPHPITVAIERRIDPARTDRGDELDAGGHRPRDRRSPGFLGSGWVRAGEGSDLWYMLYRFRDIPTLEAWEQSPQRAWWLDSGPRVRARGASRAPDRHRGLVRRSVRDARRDASPQALAPTPRPPARSSSRSRRRRRAGSRRSRSGSGSSRRICSLRGCSGSSPGFSGVAARRCACCSRRSHSRRS